MKLDIKFLKWIFLGLYIAIIVGLVGFATISEGESVPWTVFVLAITIGSQALFLFSAGTINLCRPIRRRRLVLPVVIAAFMMTVLVVSLLVALSELFKLDDDWILYGFWVVVPLSWIGWGFLFFVRHTDAERYITLRNLVASMIAGSLIQLLVTVPSHVIVSRRPGCLVGLSTAIGICCGIAVMLWSFGPGVILLFLREKREVERAREKSNHESCSDQRPDLG
jgi:hypothetical protein